MLRRSREGGLKCFPIQVVLLRVLPPVNLFLTTLVQQYRHAGARMVMEFENDPRRKDFSRDAPQYEMAKSALTNNLPATSAPVALDAADLGGHPPEYRRVLHSGVFELNQWCL